MLTATWDAQRNCYTEFAAHLAFKAWIAALEDRQGEAVCEIKARPGDFRFMYWLKPLSELPVGTLLFTSPQPAQPDQCSGPPLPCEWRPIFDAPLSDDLVWLFDGHDTIEGPRPIQSDDCDRFAYYAECTFPSTSALRKGA